MSSNTSEIFEYTGSGQHVPKDVVRVRFHPSVVEVPDAAFLNCRSLREVVLNEGLVTIGCRAFAHCRSLESITLPSTVIEIGSNAFTYCFGLEKIVLNEGVLIIGAYSFSDCSALESITIPSTVTSIEESAFSDCKRLRVLLLSEGLQMIGVAAFYGCSSLQSVTVPSSVRNWIGTSRVFAGCSNLREVVLNEGDADGIDHERLRQLSNYADQNRDDPTWYWNVAVYAGQPQELHIRPPCGWPVYTPLSSLSEEEREEIRSGESKMVSYKEPERYEGSGLHLDWGEYYVADDEMDSDDDKESMFSSFEEAEESSFDALRREELQAEQSIRNDAEQIPFEINFDQLDNSVDASHPSLMGMPDIILEKILHFCVKQPSKVCLLERVCKRIHRMTMKKDFWARHPSAEYWKKHHHYSYNTNCTRKRALDWEVYWQQRKYQYARFRKTPTNAILKVLGYGEECVAGVFRTISADIISKMIHQGPEAHFRLRGDTIGYICELLQGYMIERLAIAAQLAIHKNNWVFTSDDESDTEEPRRLIQKDDVALAFRPSLLGRGSSAFSVFGRGDMVAARDRRQRTTRRWPDDYHDVLPPEAGKRIIRRLAYAAGIFEMSNEAFVSAEAELLQALVFLLVSAYESSVEMARESQSLLREEEEITYDEPTGSKDMFRSPPPPLKSESLVYTIVPGQISTAAEQNGITPSKVYGDVWVVSAGFTKEEEVKFEQSYYYESVSLSDDDELRDSCSDNGSEKQDREEKYYSGSSLSEPGSNYSSDHVSTWSDLDSERAEDLQLQLGSLWPIDDSEMDIDDYEEEDDSDLRSYRE